LFDSTRPSSIDDAFLHYAKAWRSVGNRHQSELLAENPDFGGRLNERLSEQPASCLAKSLQASGQKIFSR
jgi:hypothetical protein